MTAAADCTPVSWLRLERYALGELGAGEHAEIAAHLATCRRCRACADEIAADAHRELPPLPAGAATATATSRADARRWRWRWPWPFGGRRQALALATTLAVVGAVFVLARDQGSAVRGPRLVTDAATHAVAMAVQVKGGAVTIELVRERDGSIAWESASFAAGDSFKVLLTCAPPLQVYADVVVIQDDGAVSPGQPELIRCGNRVPVPPAFRITGPGPATICVLIDPTGRPSRAGQQRNADASASTARACVRLNQAK